MPTSWYPQTRYNGYISDSGSGFFEDQVLDLAFKGEDRFAPTRQKWLSSSKKYGTDRYMSDVIDELNVEGMAWEDEDDSEPNPWDVDPNGDYTNWQLSSMADDILREDTRREMCRKCGEYGDETGNVASVPQKDDSGPLLDSEGNQLYVDFPELECVKSHRWFKGEGKSRGIAGKNPILFENHLQERRRREIYTKIGTPDPSIVQGMYNRTHPQGRKVNSNEQRRKNGASFFR